MKNTFAVPRIICILGVYSKVRRAAKYRQESLIKESLIIYHVLDIALEASREVIFGDLL